MNNKNIPFQTINWTQIPKTEHKGETGVAYWQILQFDGLRIRIVEYSAGYVADHWCEKGHIVHCLEGEVINEQKNGTRIIEIDKELQKRAVLPINRMLDISKKLGL